MASAFEPAVKPHRATRDAVSHAPWRLLTPPFVGLPRPTAPPPSLANCDLQSISQSAIVGLLDVRLRETRASQCAQRTAMDLGEEVLDIRPVVLGVTTGKLCSSGSTV
jgi:hypothetical protein